VDLARQDKGELVPGKCRQFELAQVAGGLEDPELREHLLHCADCALESKELERLAGLLSDLGQAESREHDSDPALWTALAARLDAPGWRERLPLPVAGVSRLAGALRQPAVAGAWAMGIAGLLLGLWLGRATAVMEEPQSYPETTLVDDAQGGVAALFTASFAEEDDGLDSTLSP